MKLKLSQANHELDERFRLNGNTVQSVLYTNLNVESSLLECRNEKTENGIKINKQSIPRIKHLDLFSSSFLQSQMMRGNIANALPHTYDKTSNWIYHKKRDVPSLDENLMTISKS